MRRLIYIAIWGIIVLGIFQSKRAFTSASGSGGGYSNAPGESHCASCHTGTSLQTSSSVISMTANDSTNLTYMADSLYVIKIITSKSGISKWGFLACPINDSTGKSIGTLSLITSSSDVQLGTASPGGKSRNYAFHTSSGNTGTNGRTWAFKWKAPHTNIGTVTFYVTVNAANGDGNNTGDVIYATPFTFKFRKTKNPEAGFTYTPASPCNGDSVSFHDTSTASPTSWSWSFPNGKPTTSNLQNPKVLYASGVFTASLVATNKFGSSPKANGTVTISKRPSDTVYQIGKNPLCQGDSLTLVADYGGTAYKWSTGETDQVIHVHTTGTYYCAVTNGSCTTISKSIKVSVIPKPNISFTRLAGVNNICQGDTLKFSLSTNGKTFSYFDQDSILAGKSNSLVLSTLIGNNLIYAIAYDSVGCPSDTSTKFKENVVAKPTIKLLRTVGKDSVCQGDTLKFKATSSVKTFSIFADGKVIGTGIATIAISNLIDSSHKVYAIAYNSLGCPSDTSTIYHENVSPKISAPSLTPGKSTTQSVTVSWLALNKASGYEVSADSGKTWKAPSGNLTHTEGNLPSNTYIKLLVRAKNNSACGHAPTGTILLSTLPCSQTTYNLNVDSSICLNSAATIVFSNISAKHYSIILNNVTSKDTAFSFKPLRDTVFHFAMFDSLKSACGSFNIEIPVRVTSVPPINILASKPFYCGTEKAIITADTGYNTYDIFKNGIFTAHIFSEDYADSAFSSGDRITEIGRINGCPSDSSNPIILNKFASPTAGYVYYPSINRKVLFIDTTKAEVARTWHFGDNTMDTTKSPQHTYSSNYTYIVSLVALNKQGCKDSVSKTIAVSGIEKAIDPESLTIVPNPFKNFIKISFYVKKSLYLHAYIVSVTGEIVVNINNLQTVVGNNEISIPVEELKPGSYILNMDFEGQTISRHIIKN